MIANLYPVIAGGMAALFQNSNEVSSGRRGVVRAATTNVYSGYCARPPFALEQLYAPGGIVSLASPESKLVYRLAKPAPDGRGGGDADLASAADYYLSDADITPTQFRERVARHVLDPEFHHDLDGLTNTPYVGFDSTVAARELTQWTDLHLDPLHDKRRSKNSVIRDQQRGERC